ncbi:MAG TPA: hypothetical protein VEI02_10265 [Planctomycetota bacterium]|nr:hypothetical protein [Planctomycetota bacterium]
MTEEPDDAKAAAKLSFLPAEVRPFVVSPWSRFYLKHDARATTLPAVKCPLFVAWFEGDLLVPPERNFAVVASHFGADPRVVACVMPGVDHFLRPSPPAPAEPGKPWRRETIAPPLLERFVGWTTAALGVVPSAAPPEAPPAAPK